MQKIIILIVSTIVLSACNSKTWKTIETIDLGEVTPIGLTYFQNNLWIADGDNNQIVQFDLEGHLLKNIEGFARPMHLDSDENSLYIPEYGSDNIVRLKEDEKTILTLTDSLDAPAGISIFEDEIAIADFYNHRIVYFNGKNWSSFGKEGKAKGEFHYPTDVQITDDRIYVADAYNNRIQVFDKSGKALQIIGEADKMNAATGIFVSTEQVFTTDFENDRVLIYNLKGSLQQIIQEELNKPTDVLMIDEILYIANYKGKSIVKLRK